MILPLGIVTTFKPVREIPQNLRIDDLYLDREAANRLSEPLHGLPRNWREAFLRIDQILKAYNNSPIEWLRQKSMKSTFSFVLGLVHQSSFMAGFPCSDSRFLIVSPVRGS